MIPRSCGSVTCQTLRQMPAPSTSAASYSSGGTRHEGGEVDDHGAAGGRPGRLHAPATASPSVGVLQPGHRPEPHPAEDRVEHAGRLGVVEELPEQHRDRGRDRRRAGRRAARRGRGPRRTSLMMHGERPAGPGSRRPAPAPRTRAVFWTAVAQQRVRRARPGSCRGRRTRRGVTRLVCWTLITNERTIGHQEKSPKTTSIGIRNSDRPTAFERRASRGRDRRRVGAEAGAVASCSPFRGHDARTGAGPAGVVGAVAPAGPAGQDSVEQLPAPGRWRRSASASMSAFSSVSTFCTTESRMRVDLLGVRRRAPGSRVWSKTPSVNDVIWSRGTLKKGWIRVLHAPARSPRRRSAGSGCRSAGRSP